MSELKIDFLESYDDDAITAELKRIASVTGKDTVNKTDIQAYGRISYELVYKRFGCLRKALEKAGLTPQRYMKPTEEELLAMLVDLWEQTIEKDGRTPQKKDLKAYGFPVSGDTYTRCFGTWNKALKKAYDSVHAANTEKTAPNEGSSPHMTPPPKRKEERISLRKRFFVMKRDSFACVLCRRSGPGIRLEVDHKVPRVQGGTDALDNLRTLCFDCNRGKRDSLE